MTRKRRDAATVGDIYRRQGWYPAPWSHHPQEAKDAIRRMGWRPRIKECFYNSQYFLYNSGIKGLEYHEGWIISVISMEHAWLVHEGQRLDLTLGPDRSTPVVYGNSVSSTSREVSLNMLLTKSYTVVKHEALAALGPWKSRWDEL